MTIRGLALVPAAVIVMAPMGMAADKNGPAPEAQTQAALKRLASLYGPAWTLTYESVITTKEFGPASGAQTTQATVHGVLQKPNKFRLEVMQNNKLIGLLVSDGDTVSLYSPLQSVYRRQAAPKNLLLGGLVTADKTPLARLTSLVPAVAMTPALFSLATRPDFLGPNATDFAASALTLHGQSALDCSWTEEGATEHLIFNQSTGLPLRSIDSSTDKSGTTTQQQEDLTAIQVGTVPLPPSAFEWTPPAGAKPVEDKPAAAPSAPPAAASPPPSKTTPSLRHRRHRKTDTGDTDSGKTPSNKIIRPATSP
ncbi:MAG: DUF2092 domain-containing protein [Armatimonadetes bacterium]|nr:DUF2092 domain-containing protein [Armatimonadota bacterium]